MKKPPVGSKLQWSLDFDSEAENRRVTALDGELLLVIRYI